MNKIYALRKIDEVGEYDEIRNEVIDIFDSKDLADKICSLYNEKSKFNHEYKNYDVKEYELKNDSQLELVTILRVWGFINNNNRQVSVYRNYEKIFKSENTKSKNFEVFNNDSHHVCKYEIIQTVENAYEYEDCFKMTQSNKYKDVETKLIDEIKENIIEMYINYVKEHNAFNIFDIPQEYYDLKNKFIELRKQIFKELTDTCKVALWDILPKYDFVNPNMNICVKAIEEIKENYKQYSDLIKVCDTFIETRTLFEEKYNHIKL